MWNHCRPHPVKKKEPNELGLYDMNGNVSELCLASPEGLSQKNKKSERHLEWCYRGGNWTTEPIPVIEREDVGIKEVENVSVLFSNEDFWLSQQRMATSCPMLEASAVKRLRQRLSENMRSSA